jgi:hypothetical protein
MILANGNGDASEGGRNPAVWLNNDGTNTLHFKLSDCNNNNEGVDKTSSIRSNEWHHIAQTYDPDTETQKVYIDGELDSTDSVCSPLGTSNEPFTVGKFRSDKWSAFPVKVDEIRIYKQRLSKSEIKQLYLQGKPFHGNYTRKVDTSESQRWGKLRMDSSIPANTEASAVFKSLGSNGNILGKEKIGLQDGLNNYSLEVPSSEDFEISFEGNSSDPTASWTVSNFSVYTSGICDYRGPENQCIMNKTTALEPKTYDVSSIFISEKNADLESISGTATLNITNSSRISGLWTGSFFIDTSNPVIKPGASFRPRNGGIMIGE